MSKHNAKETSIEVSQDVDVARLRAEFDCLLKVKDRLKRDYLLIRHAKASEIETSTYKEMFKVHRERKVCVLGAVMPWVRGAISIVGKLAIFSGLVLFVAEADSREEAAHNLIQQNRRYAEYGFGVWSWRHGCWTRHYLRQ